MATVALTTTPTQIDDGTSYTVLVTNTGATPVDLSRGGRLRPGQTATVYPEGAALTAAVASGAGSVTTATTSKPLAGPSDTFATLLAAGNRDSIAIYDEFSRYADGALGGKTPIVGPAWQTTGANPTTVASGKATSSGVGYAYAQLAAAPVALACEVGFTGGTSGAMTMAWSTSTTFDLFNLLHANFGPNGYQVTVRQDGGTFDVLMSGTWSSPMATDGTLYRVIVAVRGNRLVIYGPHGDVYASPPDPRVSAQRGTWVFWEPNTASGTVATLGSVFAYTRATTGYLGGALQPDLIAGAAAAGDGNGRLWGSPGTSWGVAIGKGNASGQPSVTFGPPTYYTALSAAASIGAGTVSLRDSVPSGTVFQIESGNGSESVTTTGNPTGSGPYTTTLTGTLAKAHASGVAVIGTAPSSRKTEMYLNQANGQFFLPDLAVVCVPQNLYFSSNLDVNLSRSAAGVLSMGAAQSFRTGRNVTGSRPSASAVGQGAQFFDTTLNKPIWSTGSAWVDATGAAV